MIHRIKDSTLATLREVVNGDPYHRQFQPLVDEIDWLRAELAAAHAAIDQVRRQHHRGAKGMQGTCMACGHNYPCPTLRALDGDA